MSEHYRRWTQTLRVPAGFLLAIAFLALSHPTRPAIALGGGIALLGIALRFWAAGHIEKGRVLTTTGPYAFTRNPLYLGSLIIGIGFGIISGTLTIPLLFAAYFFLVYWPVMKQEEKELRDTFQTEFMRYAERVPRLFPRLRRSKAEPADRSQGFKLTRAMRNREYNAILGYIGMILLLWLWLAAALPAQPAAEARPPYDVGETLTYEIKWDPPRWMIFLPATYTAGSLTLHMEQRLSFQGAPAYKLIAQAQSSGILPKIARISIQDRFESWVDARSHCMLKSVKQLREGKRKRDIEVVRGENRTVHLREMDAAVQPPQEKKNKDLTNVPPCVQDLLSALYVVRLNRFAVNDQYAMDVLDEDRVKTIQILVQKKESVQVNSVMTPAIRVEAVAVFGGLFKSGGKLKVWVSDDERKVPLKFDAQVKYGHVYGFLKTSQRPGEAARVTD